MQNNFRQEVIIYENMVYHWFVQWNWIRNYHSSFGLFLGGQIHGKTIDTQGEIGWGSGTFRKAGRPDAHVIEVLTEQTSAAYRDYLRKYKVSYVLAGSETFDCRIAVKKLYQLFGIDTMLICGGGTVNWTFLQQGVVDELSLMLAPAADGTPDTVSVFEKSASLSASVPVEFQLKKIETLKHDGVRLIYSVKGNS